MGKQEGISLDDYYGTGNEKNVTGRIEGKDAEIARLQVELAESKTEKIKEYENVQRRLNQL